MSQTTHAAAAFGRLLIAALFLMSGVGKLAAPLATQGYIGAVVVQTETPRIKDTVARFLITPV